MIKLLLEIYLPYILVSKEYSIESYLIRNIEVRLYMDLIAPRIFLDELRLI